MTFIVIALKTLKCLIPVTINKFPVTSSIRDFFFQNSFTQINNRMSCLVLRITKIRARTRRFQTSMVKKTNVCCVLLTKTTFFSKIIKITTTNHLHVCFKILKKLIFLLQYIFEILRLNYVHSVFVYFIYIKIAFKRNI